MSLYNIKVNDKDNNEVEMSIYKEQVLLIVNTATGCGFTPQYEGLQNLYEKYQGQGFSVLDFPCNQFGSQAPGTMEEITEFCALNYNTTFPMFAKTDVNGDNENPVFTYLKAAKKSILGTKVKWNFTKFLVDRNGKVIKRYAPTVKPEEIEKDILKLL